MQDWIQVVRQLCECFQENEERLRFINEIDKKILDNLVSLECLLNFVIDKLTRFSKAGVGCFHIKSGGEFLFLCSSKPLENSDPILIEETSFKDALNRSAPIFQEWDRKESAFFAPQYKDSITRIIVPVLVGDNLWGIMTFESILPGKSSPLSDEETKKFFQNISNQLAIAIQSRVQYDEITQLWKIQNAFFDKELDISECLKSLIESIKTALPSIKPLRIEPLPEVQILFYQEGREHLAIRATSGIEPLNTRVSVKESISGILVEKPQEPYFVCDPTEYSGRYKSYLGKDAKGTLEKEIRTELVIPLRSGDKMIGVINLESENENAFKEQHIQAMISLAEKISPIINALQTRVQKSQLQSQASLYALNRFLVKFSQTYSHKMGTPINCISMRMELMQKRIEPAKQIDDTLKSSLDDDLKTLAEAISNIDEYHRKFCKDLPGFLYFGKYSINTLIQDAINELHPDVLKEKCRTEIAFNPQDEYCVFCSPFLKEHIYNILNNSKESILERIIKQEDHKGKISIETSLETDNEEKDLNQRCIIKIVDNGIGIEKSILPKVVMPSFTTKEHGKGFGLFAANEYLKSIGGKLEVKGEPLDFCEVKIYLDIYKDIVHGKKDMVRGKLDAFSVICKEE